MKRIVTFFILTFIFTHLHAQQKDIDAVKKIEQTRIASLVTKDTAALNKIYANDVVFVNALGETLDKKKVLELLMQPDRKYTSATIDSITAIRIIGNTAVLITKTTLVRILHDVVSILHNGQMAVYEKRKNNWVVIALHTTLLNAK